MRKVIGPCLVLASCCWGCGANSAIEVVVESGDPNLGVEHVRLYIGLDDPLTETASRLIPGGYLYDAVPKGFYWRRDPNNDQDVAVLAAGETSMKFAFQPGSGDHKLGIVIAIGYKGDKPVAAAARYDLTLESGQVRRYEMTLEAAVAPPPNLKMPAGPLMIHTWGTRDDPAACAQLIDTRVTTRPNVYVVTKHDIDCDGFVSEDANDEREVNGCLVDVFNAHVRAKQDALTCLTGDMIPASPVGTNATMACVLGGKGCVDGRPAAMPACDASVFCAPAALCEHCASDPAAIGCASALEPTAEAEVPHISCTVPAEPISAQALKVCEEPLNLIVPNLAVLGVECKDFKFLTPPKTTPDAAITYAFPGGTASFTPEPAAGCHFALRPTGQVPMNSLRLTSLVEVTLANGRGIALPIVLDIKPITPDCQNQTTVVRECRLVGGDGIPMQPELLQCVKTPIVDPW